MALGDFRGAGFLRGSSDAAAAQGLGERGAGDLGPRRARRGGRPRAVPRRLRAAVRPARAALRVYLRNLGAEAALAEDLAQDVMTTVWRRAGQFEASRATASTWIFAIAATASSMR